MNNRLRSIFYIYFLAGVLICFSSFVFQTPTAFAQDPVPTPTYDPLTQPELPPNPTEFEMGRYLFWRHCMPCHGDVGQGLTDEFRILWEDHQNCWDHGCHGGKRGDEGFPIPTVIPAIVTNDKLIRFGSEEELYKYLKTTHPPQDPGFLKDEEYHSLAAYVFRLNNRSVEEIEVIQTVSPTISRVPTPTPSSQDNQTPIRQFIVVFGFLFFSLIVVWVIQKNRK